MVVVDGSVMLLEKGELWLDNIYLRLASKREEDTFATYIWVQRAGEMWGTQVTLQGNGDGMQDCRTCGLGTTRDGSSYFSSK